MFKVTFDKTSFLKKGAIFGFNESFTLFWGEDFLQSDRPKAQSALCKMDFFQENVIWKSYEFYAQFSKDELKELFGSSPLEFHWEGGKKEDFVVMFDQTQRAIHKKELEKLVPYTQSTSPYKNEVNFIENALHHAVKKDKGYLYGEWDSEGGFLGLTPEVLVQLEGQNLSTMALAGTTTKKEFEVDPEKFLSDPKEINEHQKVVDEIYNQLKKYGDVAIGERKATATPNLVHFQTDIKLNKFDANLDELVQNLHPTPALGSFPQSAGKGYLKKWDHMIARGIFGAPFGFSSGSDFCIFVVAIRNIIWNLDRIKLLVGCGVVADSQVDKEWLELENKTSSVKEIFGVL